MLASVRRLFANFFFFLGWLLSPLTFWNDAFVNIPLAYICAVLYTKFFTSDFLLTVLVFYWLSNILGIVLMYAAGKKIIQEGEHPVKKLVILIIDIAVYSAILVIIYKMGVLKPISLPILK